MKKSDVFVLSDSTGKILSPALQATVLAKYSRSPLSAREVIETLTEEESSKFNEKWFVEYNHSSVGELATLALCFENVSMVASKFLESFQRAAYSEKSTRYQKFNSESFVLPPGCPETMSAFSRKFYDAYESLYPKVVQHLCKKLNRAEDRLIRARAFDNVRYLLPAGTGTNLGMVINARDFRHFVNQALGHRNPEIRMLGEQARQAVEKVYPVYVKHVKADSFEPNFKYVESSAEDSTSLTIQGPRVSLHRPTSWLRPEQSKKYFWDMVSNGYGMSKETFNAHMNQRKGRGVPRIFREIPIKLDVIMDYGAYRDLQRHRRMEIFAEPLSTVYGYEIPDDIKENPSLRDEYCNAMQCVHTYADSDIVNDTELHQYVIPMGFYHRSIMSMDLAQLYYITELRTKPQGHISYRRIAWSMVEAGKNAYGDLMSWCQAQPPNEIGDHT